MTSKGRRIAIAALCCAGFGMGASLSQESDAEDDAAPPAVDEEIVVRDRSRAVLRTRIRLAEEAVYRRWNEINSDDDFDIHCRQEAPTGARTLRRVCQADFWRDAQAAAGRETVLGLQGSGAFPAEQYLAEAQYKRGLMEDEMRRLATEDEEFLEAIMLFARLTQATETRTLPGAASAPTASRRLTAEEEGLPYGAAAVAEVRVGREPWTHALSRPTFTIARVYGDIRGIEIECGDHAERLQWEEAAEWTLPASWVSCALRVDAEPGTTFALYEFD